MKDEKAWFSSSFILAFFGSANVATSDPKPPAGSGEIRAHAQAAGLAAGWLLNENAGTSVVDIGPNANNGTFGTGVSWQSSGRVGPSAQFPGTNAGHISVPHNAAFNITSGLSVEVWFKCPTSIPSGGVGLVSKVGASNQGGFGVFLSGGIYPLGKAQFTTFVSGVSDDLLGSAALNDNQWHQVVCVYDGAKKSLYVDGLLDVSAAYTGSLDTNSDALSLGGNIWTALPLPYGGLLDQVRIYGRALTAADVLDRYQNPFADIWNIVDGHPYTAPSYFPLYWRDGYWPPASAAFAPPSSASHEVDIRLYNADGTRKYLPQQWIESAEFELAERGGMQNGSLSILAPWEQLQLAGTEYVDIWLWGQRLYRGWVRTAQNELNVPEKANPTLYGLMEFLNGYLVRRCYCYAQPVDISQVFLDLANEYVVRSNRLPNLVLDAGGVPALGIQIQSFCAKGKTVSQALNDLCDQAPGQLIWGGDVDASGNNRLYLRPRATSTKYKFPVGDKVSAILYPRDATQVVNRVYVTGGKADPPNLASNGSFEECVLPGQLTSNVLLNPSFEQGLTYWGVYNDPTVASGFGRTDTNAVNFDNNPSAPEEISQNIAVSAVRPVNVAFYLQAFAGELWGMQVRVMYYSGGTLVNAPNDWRGGTLVVEQDSIVFSPTPNGAYQLFTFSAAFAGSVGLAATYMQVLFTMVQTGGTPGTNFDDASVWFTDENQSDQWAQGLSVNANFALLDWANKEIAAYDGSLCVKAQANILVAGGYAEIRNTLAARIDVKPSRTYTLVVFFQAVSASASVRIGTQEFTDSTAGTTTLSDATTIASGSWQIVLLAVTTGTTTNVMDLEIRLYDGNAVYIDAVGLYEGASRPGLYYTGDTFQAVRSVTDYSAGQIGSDAAASITAWGEREKAEQIDTVLDTSTLDAYCIGYFKSKAAPVIQGRLTLKGATDSVGLDGLVQVENLPSAPPALFPSRLRYQIGQTIDIDIDLNNERPDLALLLRNAVIGASK
jgi:hypothetical protein